MGSEKLEVGSNTLIMKRKCKQRWSTTPQISTKRTHISHLHSRNTIKTTTYAVVNPGPGMGKTQQCGGVNGNTYINKR
jgi:hypothetical protein